MNTGVKVRFASLEEAIENTANNADLERARSIAVTLEQENAELGERLAGALAAARDLICICDPMFEPDICRACCVVAQLEIPGSSNYFTPPF